MKAIVIRAYGNEEQLQEAEVPKPEPGPRDLLVRVKATGINPVDVKKCFNFGNLSEKLESPFILGWDGAGVVEATGAEVTSFHPGDEVFFAGVISRNGTYAQYTVVDERIVGRKPKSVSFEEAAGVPLTAITAWEGLVEGMGLSEGGEEKNLSLLVVGGAGGAGSMEIQIAKKILKVKNVIATASRPESQEFCTKMGADFVIDHKKDLAQELERVGFRGVDLIFLNADVEDYMGRLAPIINPLGKIVLITVRSNAPSEILPFMGKRVSLIWEMMFTRALFGVEPERQGQILNRVSELVDAGVIQPRVTKVYPDWSEIKQIHRDSVSGSVIGKVVVTIP